MPVQDSHKAQSSISAFGAGSALGLPVCLREYFMYNRVLQESQRSHTDPQALHQPTELVLASVSLQGVSLDVSLDALWGCAASHSSLSHPAGAPVPVHLGLGPTLFQCMEQPPSLVP